ncbi:MAG: hypothetical protein SW833_07000 [Cyanobacteriota bacterium]|nr:hypothetical protein [Cyanobacteriota bacterium]
MPAPNPPYFSWRQLLSGQLSQTSPSQRDRAGDEENSELRTLIPNSPIPQFPIPLNHD